MNRVLRGFTGVAAPPGCGHELLAAESPAGAVKSELPSRSQPARDSLGASGSSSAEMRGLNGKGFLWVRQLYLGPKAVGGRA